MVGCVSFEVVVLSISPAIVVVAGVDAIVLV